MQIETEVGMKMSKDRLGIVIITYAKSERLENVRRLIDLYAGYDIFLSVDGPVDGTARKKFEVLKKPHVRIRYMSEKLHSRRHCPCAVTWIAGVKEFFLVLEDDITMSAKIDIEKYTDFFSDHRIFSISLYSGFHTDNSLRETPFFSPWGWIGSSSTWMTYAEEKDSKGLHVDNLMAASQQAMWTRVLQKNKQKSPQHWDYNVQNYLFNNNMLVLCTPTIVRNNGFGSDATNAFTRPSGYIGPVDGWKVGADTKIIEGSRKYVQRQCWKMFEFPYNLLTRASRLAHRIQRRLKYGSYISRSKVNRQSGAEEHVE